MRLSSTPTRRRHTSQPRRISHARRGRRAAEESAPAAGQDLKGRAPWGNQSRSRAAGPPARRPAGTRSRAASPARPRADAQSPHARWGRPWPRVRRRRGGHLDAVAAAQAGAREAGHHIAQAADLGGRRHLGRHVHHMQPPRVPLRARLGPARPCAPACIMRLSPAGGPCPGSRGARLSRGPRVSRTEASLCSWQHESERAPRSWQRPGHASARRGAQAGRRTAQGARRAAGAVRAGRSQNGGLSPGDGHAMPHSARSAWTSSAGAPAGSASGSVASSSNTTCRHSACCSRPGGACRVRGRAADQGAGGGGAGGTGAAAARLVRRHALHSAERQAQRYVLGQQALHVRRAGGPPLRLRAQGAWVWAGRDALVSVQGGKPGVVLPGASRCDAALAGPGIGAAGAACLALARAALARPAASPAQLASPPWHRSHRGSAPGQQVLQAARPQMHLPCSADLQGACAGGMWGLVHCRACTAA